MTLGVASACKTGCRLTNQHWFRELAEARATISEYQEDYNEVCPHSALGNLVPREFAQRLQGRESGVAIA